MTRLHINRRLRPYLWALGLLWLLPAVAVLLGYLVLPEHNSSGQCEGIGFGCTLTPADTVVLLGMLASPVLLVAGLVAVVIIGLVQSRRERTPTAPNRSP